ncbi:MAG: YceI family protein [Chitinophagales bacterium]
MKKTNLILLMATSVFLAASCTNAPKSYDATTSEAKEVVADGTAKAFKVDTSASKVEWVGTKVSGYHSGTIRLAGGELLVKDGVLTGGKFTLDMNSMNVTGPAGSNEAMNAKLLGHLTSADFFDTAAFPDAAFEVTAIKPFSGMVAETSEERQEDISEYKVADPTHMISGNLTLKGVTKNIEFPARVTITENSADAVAKFNIDRSMWNIVYPGKPDDLIRDEIHLGIALKATML